MDRPQVIRDLVMFAVGWAVGGIVINQLVRSKYERQAAEEIAAVKTTYRKKYEKKEELLEETREADIQEVVDLKVAEQLINLSGYESKTSEMTREQLEEALRDFGKVHAKPNLEDLVPEKEEVSEEESDEALDENAPKRDKPFVISFKTFDETRSWYSKLSYEYYEADNVLVDESESIVNDVAYYVGLDSLNRFGALGADPNTVYVRNDIVESDYEIVKVPEGLTYAESVLGIMPEEEEKQLYRKMRDYDDD